MCIRDREKYVVSRVVSLNSKALESLYLFSLCISKAGKPHFLGGELILSIAKDIVKTPLVKRKQSS